MRYFMSDPHFGHKNILEFSRTEFDSIEKHDYFLVDQINETVHPTKDSLFILGDIAFSSHHFMLAAISCQNITIVLGNHDYTSKVSKMLELRKDLKFAGAHDLRIKSIGNIILTHIPVHPGQLYDSKTKLGRYKANVHGHLHQLTVGDPRYVNVSMEQLDNYKPMSEHQLEAILLRGKL